jgi:cation diffusion facilitator family transporter
VSACCASDACHAPPPDRGYRRVLWIALALNGAMFVIEATAGVFAGSVSLQADALDFMGDAANYAVGLIVLGMEIRWRARAAMVKGLVMGIFAFYVAANTIWHAYFGGTPQPNLMGGIGLLALSVNLGVAILLFRHRQGDANRLSVWLCTRNDAIANVAVILAGGGVWLTGTYWPDISVAAVITYLGLTGAWQVLRQARRDVGAGLAEIPAE